MSGLLELKSQAQGQRPSSNVVSRSQFSVLDDFDDWDDGIENFCGVWLLRIVAVLIAVTGSVGMSEYASVDAETCPRAASILSLWTAMASLGESWLAMDVVGCAFILRIMWLDSHCSILARIFKCSVWCLAVFGLSQYSMQITSSRKCWGYLSALVMVALMLAVLLPIFWCLLIDCDNMCTTCGEAGHDTCLGGFEMLEWPEAIEPYLQECGDLELAVRRRSAAQSQSMPAGRRGTSAVPEFGDEPSAEIMGKRSDPSKAQRHISVIRDGRVLHVGTTRRAVKRWIRRYAPERRGITIEDSAMDSSTLACSAYVSDIQTPPGQTRPATPPSSRGSSNPPSPQLSSPRLQPQGET